MRGLCTSCPFQFWDHFAEEQRVCCLGQNFLNPSTVIFRKVEKKYFEIQENEKQRLWLNCMNAHDCLRTWIWYSHSGNMSGSRGGNRGSGTPWKKEFLSNTGPDLLKITKLPGQRSMLGHHRHASETPFKWCFAGGPMMARLKQYLDPTSPHQLKF